MSEDRRELRRELLDRVVALQMAVQINPDGETKAELEQAREALRLFDEQSMALFNKEISGASR